MYYGVKTLQCKICLKPYQLVRGCILSGLDCLCDDCIQKVWNGGGITAEEIKSNYEERIQEIEAALPPDIGPARQAMKREIIELRNKLSLQTESLASDLSEYVEAAKTQDIKLNDLLIERRT